MNTDVAAGLATLGEPTRRRIVERLAGGPLSVHEIADRLPVGRPAVSMHLRVLKEAGLVLDQRKGTRRLYQLNPEALAALRDYLDWYWTLALASYKQAVELQEEGGGDAMAPEVRPEVRVTKSIVVAAARVRAFAFFIRQEAWWPVRTHHLAEPPGETVILEPFVGGRWFERWSDGRECDWGTVLVWEPPRRIVLTWQIGSDWVYEPDPTRASEIEVRFLPESPQRTRIEFEHRRLERYGEQAEPMRAILDAPNCPPGCLAQEVFSIDPIEYTSFKAGIERSFETGRAAYLVVEALADEQLKLGSWVIIDPMNAEDAQRRRGTHRPPPWRPALAWRSVRRPAARRG